MTLTITAACGTRTVMHPSLIHAQAPPSGVGFSGTPTGGSAPLAVAFHGTAAETLGTAYRWDFGDGAAGAGRNPIHVYEEPGVYTVRMTAVRGCSTRVTRLDYIHVTGGSGAGTRIFADVRQACAPFTTRFKGDGGLNRPSWWLWDFGDGTTSALSSPLHEYTERRPYTVTLTVGTRATSVTTTHPDFIHAELPPVPDFVVGDPQTCVGLPVPFQNRTRGSVLGWFWDFGDGTTSTDRDPVHAWSEAGTYDVSLLAMTECGNASTVREDVIEVLPAGSPECGDAAAAKRDASDAARGLDADGASAGTPAISFTKPHLGDPLPNPSASGFAIPYGIPADGADVSMSVFDSRGRLVRHLVGAHAAGGLHTVSWDGRDASGASPGAGIYFVRMTAGGAALTRKVIVIE